MNPSEVAFGFGAALNVAYLILAFRAFRCIRQEHKGERLAGVLAFWPLHDIYDRTAKGLRLLGFCVLVLCIGAYVLSARLS
jgi:hypothetical protein